MGRQIGAAQTWPIVSRNLDNGSQVPQGGSKEGLGWFGARTWVGCGAPIR